MFPTISWSTWLILAWTSSPNSYMLYCYLNNNNRNKTKSKPIHYAASLKADIRLPKSVTITITEFFNRILLRKEYKKSCTSEAQVNYFKLSMLSMSWVL